jgi:hypothetical protein
MVYSLTPNEIELVKRGMEGDIDLFCRYWFRKEGGDDKATFKFDTNFTEAGAWQKKMIYAKQSLIVNISGIGTGKTLGVGMAAVFYSLTTSDFRFMNGAEWSYQAKLMYDLILATLEDTPAWKLISSMPSSPYPKIEFKYKVGAQTYKSTMEFMSMDKNANKIFSWRGDWINLDEAGLISNLDEVMMNLSTRLTGRTLRQRDYMGRMSIMSNPWDQFHLWHIYDMAISDPENCLSITVSTRENKNITDKQIADMVKHIPEEERARFLDGLRPEGSGDYFSKQHVINCEDANLSEYITSNIKKETPGFTMQSMIGVGCVHYTIPVNADDDLILVGDPGNAAPPARNAPVLFLIKTTNYPSIPATVVGFWWGDGHGQVMPFVDKLNEWKDKYKPFFVGIDSTGPQAGMASILNVQRIWDGKLTDDTKITGLDFSGSKKPRYLVSLRILIELGLLKWASIASGIRSQLTNYDPLKDHVNVAKIPQDIVSALSMASYVIRAYYANQDTSLDQDGDYLIYYRNQYRGYNRTPEGIRNRHSLSRSAEPRKTPPTSDFS